MHGAESRDGLATLVGFAKDVCFWWIHCPNPSRDLISAIKVSQVVPAAQSPSTLPGKFSTVPR